MSTRDEWLHELRDYNVPDQPSSGGYRPRLEVIKDIATTCGLPFPPNGTQTKADWRAAVRKHFTGDT